jgi:hypothetical protein
MVVVVTFLFGPTQKLFRLSVGAAVDSEVRAGDVRPLRTSHERDQRSNLVNMPVAVERCGGLLEYRPIACSGVQVRVNQTPGWTLLTVMPRLPTSLDNP